MQKKCAVVGANGFLGSALARKLKERGYPCTAIYNENSSKIDEDVDKMNVEEFLGTENFYDYIFLSLGNYLCSYNDLININNTIYAILNKNGKAKIVFISSTNVYGLHDEIIHVGSSYNNPTLYPFSKLAGEFLVGSHEKYVILRLTYLYGKGLDNKSFLPNIINKSKETGEIVLFGNGERKQDYLHIDDAVELCILSIENDINGTFLGASGVSVSNREVAEIISQKHHSVITYTGVETGHSFYFNIMNTTKDLGWRPKISINEGLNQML